MLTLLLLLPPLNSQNTVNSLQRQSSTQSEALLLRGSSYISLSSSLPLQPGDLMGFSFRSCHSGQLVSQGDSQSSVSLRLREGSVELTLRAGGETRTEEVGGAGLSDGAWHTVRLSVAPGLGDRLCLSVDTDMECDQPSSGPRVMNSLEERSNVRRMDNVRNFLDSIRLATASSPVTVGSGLVACIREGPGLRFTTGAIRDNGGVSWGSCLLPQSCQGYDWEGASSSSSTSCGGDAGCQNGGVCFPREGGQAPSCVCPPGYTGDTCTEVTTRCQEIPCLHGGNCSDSSDGYVCQCEDTGYSGDHCHLEDNSCAGQTCSNGATCLDQPGGFLCDCAGGFTGRTCEARLEVCACSNGGTCLASGSCSCPPGYSGARCQVEDCAGLACPEGAQCQVTAGQQPSCVCGPGYSGEPSTGCVRQSLCSPSPCHNGALCTDNISDFNCSCPAGWQGHLCQDDIPECDTQPCLNNGTCTELPGSFSCSCPPTHQGRTCQTDVDECVENPCVHGTCVNMDNGYRCSCLAGFEGAQCEELTDECATGPCLNGATCITENSSYRCQCSPRFMGDRCEQQYDPCVDSPCENGATCSKVGEERTEGQDFTCQCTVGYTGPSCQLNIDDCLGVTDCTTGQHCVDLVNSYKCCQLGFRGAQCEENINECEVNPCQNEGRCIDGVAEFECECREGWTGEDCSQDVDECVIPSGESSNICNDGICINEPGSFQCYCKPGYSGDRCDFDFNECLSNPCQNNGSCSNLVNSYSCICVAGFNGSNCEFNIDECEGDPCFNGATCLDGINNFTCKCSPGYEGRDCGVDIDDCQSAPCLNGGQCTDGVNMFTCNCDDTGFTGDTCQLDIDECEVEPCQHNSNCTNEINNYTCNCWPGYQGKNCSQDIPDCQDSPCKNNAACYEYSNVSLYARPEDLPAEIKPHFLEGFSYNKAEGRLCLCPTGFNGTDCGNNIDDCLDSPCQHEASCEDGIATYTCHCKPGYEGENCEVQIDECERYQPCENNAKCRDLTADYSCLCPPEFGGKNCSVPLTGCLEVNCLNNGSCTPWLIGETDHRANCSCTPGYTGDTCQIQTTFSFKGDSYISVMSNRHEGYELDLRFRTTLSNGTLAIGQGQGQGFFKLELLEGRLRVYSGMLRLEDGVDVGDLNSLNDTTWHKAFLALNSSHLTLGLDDRYQRIETIYPDDLSQPAFNMTSLGGRPETDTIIPSTEFVGCIQDISVNGMKVREDLTNSPDIIQKNTEVGCERTEQCKPNPCENDGVCIDLWRRNECRCKRPYLGPNCQYTYTGATFGHENITDSQAVVTISNPRSYKDNIDLTMFIRTKQKNGFVFYLGKSDLNHTIKNNIIGRLVDGTLQVETSINDLDKVEPFILFSEQLSDGNRHFIHVKRMSKEITVSINESTSLVQELSAIVPIQAEKLYLGNLIMKDEESRQSPPTTVRPTTTTTVTTTTTTAFVPTTTREELETTQFTVENVEDITTAVAEPLLLSRQQREVDDEVHAENIFFKGVIQDVRLGNGKTTSIVNLFNLTTEIERELTENKIPSLGVVKTYNLREGVVSDDTCRNDPCQNGGTCHVTWNAFICECPEGFKGADCSEIEYCFASPCPEDSHCNTLSDGFECISNLTLNGVNTSLSYKPKLSQSVKIDSIKLMFRTQSSGTLMQLVNNDGQNISFNINNGRFEIIARTAVGTVGENFTFGHDIDDGSWHMIVLQLIDKSLGFLDNGTGDEELLEENSIFNNLTGFINSSKIILGSSIREEDSSLTNHFRGCLNEIRIAEILLPYFTDAVNQTTKERFVLEEQDDLTRGECVLCYQAECSNDGQCYDPSEEFDCRCPTGFEGPTCGENIICQNHSCDHGECLEGRGNYTCTCQLGWVGWLCDQDKDECEDSPCQNEGICTQTLQPGGYTCQCGEAYKGDNCQENRIKNCSHSPCQNGGSCVPRNNTSSSNKYSCDCAQGYEGFNCDSRIDYCVELNKNCQNGGECKSQFSSFSALCLCQPGYTGEECQTDVDDCAETPCHNGGACTDLINGFQCDCAGTGFLGQTCQENIDECALEDPCHHGRCNDTVGDYKCLCEESYCGKNCNMLDPCLRNETLCKNEGSCRAVCEPDQTFICECITGWEGVNCHLKSSQTEELALIVGPIVGGMAFIALVGLFVFLVMARRKRKGEGHYRPAKQELTSPRLQLDNMLKIPPEERLI